MMTRNVLILMAMVMVIIGVMLHGMKPDYSCGQDSSSRVLNNQTTVQPLMVIQPLMDSLDALMVTETESQTSTMKSMVLYLKTVIQMVF